jgi:CubicO group peptidase (beta-lactamase class C family)
MPRRFTQGPRVHASSVRSAVPSAHAAASFLPALALVAALTMGQPAQAQSVVSAIDQYVQPYVGSGKFSGAVLVTRSGDIVFDKAYGYADIDGRVENTTATSFHIGALSNAYTAAIVMHLVEKGSLSLDNTVAQFLPGVPNGDRITIGDLLLGMPGAPGPEGAYEVLARIVELRTGTSFKSALSGFLFGPYWMEGAGVDSDDLGPGRRYARGYVSDGKGELKPADTVRWSARTGSASLYTTTHDELRFVNALFGGDVLMGSDLLKSETRAAMFDDAKSDIGYGWYRRDDKALGGRLYFMTAELAGFSAFVMHIRAANTTVILLGNVDSPATAQMGRDIAALALAPP